MLKPSTRFAIASIGLLVSSPVLAQGTCANLAYQKQIQPLFDTYCVARHQDASPASGLSLQTGTALNFIASGKSSQSGMALITPSDPEKSYLYRKLTNTQIEAGGGGERMPLAGRLSVDNVKRVEDWIRDCVKSAP